MLYTNNSLGSAKVTFHAINFSVDRVLSQVEKKKRVLGIFIDLSKAFDKLKHGKLLVKLENYGIRGTVHKILTRYLSGRDQQLNSKLCLPATAFLVRGER